MTEVKTHRRGAVLTWLIPVSVLSERLSTVGKGIEFPSRRFLRLRTLTLDCMFYAYNRYDNYINYVFEDSTVYSGYRYRSGSALPSVRTPGTSTCGLLFSMDHGGL